MPINPPKPPPKRGRPAGKTTATVTQVSEQDAITRKRKEGLDGWMQFAAAGAIATKNYADAGAIGLHGERFTTELAKTGQFNDRMGKLLDYLASVGPWSGVISAALTLGLQFAANHKQVPAEAVQQFGVVPPDLLETQMKLEIEELRAQLQAQLAEKQQEVRELRVSYTPAPAGSNGGRMTVDKDI